MDDVVFEDETITIVAPTPKVEKVKPITPAPEKKAAVSETIVSNTNISTAKDDISMDEIDDLLNDAEPTVQTTSSTQTASSGDDLDDLDIDSLLSDID